MRHTLRLHGVVVGWSDLEVAEPQLGRARGRFRPGIGYDLVQPGFRLFTEAVPRDAAGTRDQDKLERYYKARDALQLELHDDTGQPIATETIHIADYSAEQGGTIEIDVLIRDDRYWQRR